MTRRFITLLLGVSFGLASALFAQDKAPAVKITLRLLAFGPQQKVKEVFIHDPAAPPETAPFTSEIKNYLNGESVTVTSFGQKLVFTRAKERESMGRQDSVIGEVALPAKTRSALLLFLPGKPGDKASSQVMVIDDSIGSFPAGSYYVTNLSPQPVRIELEKKPFVFKPANSSLIKDPPVRANNHSGMRAFAFANNEWLPIASGLWPHPGRSRSLLVLFPNPTTGTVNLRAFGDVPPKKSQL